MRSVLTNFGTTGDVQPFVALGLALKRHGHQPVLALSPGHAPLAERHGLAFAPVGPDLRDAQTAINRALIAGPAQGAPPDLVGLFGPLALAQPAIYADLKAACAGADVLVSGRVQGAARAVHDATHLPFVTVYLEHTGSGGGATAIQAAMRALFNPLRAQLGLAPFENPMVDGESPQLALHAISRHVRPLPPDAPPHHRVTGFLFLDEEGWSPGPALEAFLAAGPPPVVITFGSMPSGDPEALTDLLIDAALRTGRRVLIQQGWEWLRPRALPPTVFAAGAIPHAWLFPRAACVVHHGGAGTVGAVLRAGVPQVVVPHAFDQFLWADIVRARGVAGAPVDRSALTAEALAVAVRQALDGPAIADTARTLGEQVRAEHGVDAARREIEALVGRIGLAAEPDDETAGAVQQRRRATLQRQRERKREVESEG